MLRRLLLALALLAVPAMAQTVASIHGDCAEGKTAVSTQGLASTNRVMASYPACTVTVYDHGTTNLSTIYSDSSLTPLANPFVATTLGDPGSNGFGDWIFYAAIGTSTPDRYDVVMSGGQFGGFPAPYTIPDIYLWAGAGGGGGGLIPCGAPNDVQLFLNATNLDCDTGVFYEDPVAHIMYVGNGTVPGTIVATKEVDVTDTSQAGEVNLTAGPLGASPGTTIVGIAAPAASASGLRLILPADKGTDGQVLQQLSHSGQDVTLDWLTPGSSGGIYAENLSPVYASNCTTVSGVPCTTANPFTPADYAQATSNTFRGPRPGTIANAVAGNAYSTSGTGSTMTWTYPGYLPPHHVIVFTLLARDGGGLQIHSPTMSTGETPNTLHTGASGVMSEWQLYVEDTVGGVGVQLTATITNPVAWQITGMDIGAVPTSGSLVASVTSGSSCAGQTLSFPAITTGVTSLIVGVQTGFQVGADGGYSTFTATAPDYIGIPQGQFKQYPGGLSPGMGTMIMYSQKPAGTYTLTAVADANCNAGGISLAFAWDGSDSWAAPFWAYYDLSDLIFNGSLPDPSGHSGAPILANALGNGYEFGAFPAGGVSQLNLQNNGTPYGSVLSGQIGTFNFLNCTVAGAAPSFTISCTSTGITGIGTANVMTKFTGAASVGNSQFQNSSANTMDSPTLTQGLTYQGGSDASSAAALGGVTARGADQTAAGAAGSAGGTAQVRGGNNAGTNAASQAGSVEITPGASTGATQGLQGLLALKNVYVLGGGTSTQWYLQCIVTTTAMTVNNCGATPETVLGVAAIVGANTVRVNEPPSQTPVAASAAVTVGHTVCAGATAGKVTDSAGTATCTYAQGAQIGVVLAVAGIWNLPDGNAVTLSTTLPLVRMGGGGRPAGSSGLTNVVMPSDLFSSSGTPVETVVKQNQNAGYFWKGLPVSTQKPFLVSSTICNLATSVTLTCPLNAATSAGHLLTVSLTSTHSASTITDNLSSTYSDHAAQSAYEQMDYWALANTPAGITSVIITQLSTGVGIILVQEWAGVALTTPLETATAQTGGACTPPYSLGPITLSNPTDLVIVLAATSGGSVYTAGTGYSLGPQSTGGAAGFSAGSEYAVVSAGTYTPTIGCTGGVNEAGFTQAYKAATSPASLQPIFSPLFVDDTKSIAIGPIYDHSGTFQNVSPHIVEDVCTLGTNCSVTLTGSSVFTGTTSYQCTCTDQTSAAACKFAPSSGSAFALTGTGTDVLSYICVGN